MIDTTQLTERLSAAAQAVDEARLEADLRLAGFEHALHVLANSDGGSADDATPPFSSTAAPGAGSGARHQAIASRTGASVVAVERVFEEIDGEIRLTLPPSALPPSKAAAMRDVALLLVTARQAAGLDEYTPFGTIRAECIDLNVLDGPNFATEVGKLGFRLRGPRSAREARASRHHFEKAGQLVRELAERI